MNTHKNVVLVKAVAAQAEKNVGRRGRQEARISEEIKRLYRTNLRELSETVSGNPYPLIVRGTVVLGTAAGIPETEIISDLKRVFPWLRHEKQGKIREYFKRAKVHLFTSHGRKSPHIFAIDAICDVNRNRRGRKVERQA